MDLKRVMVYVSEADQAARQQVEASVDKVLVTYDTFLIAEADEQQLDSLKNQDLNFEVQKDAQKIRLRAVEFDTSEAPPAPPAPAAADIVGGARGHWIVQFVGPVKAEWLEEIRGHGGTVGDYVPENAFLVEMDAPTKDQIAALAFVSWVGAYEPAYKMSPLLMGAKAPATMSALADLAVDTEAFPPAPVGNITVHLHDPAGLDKLSTEIENLGGQVVVASKARIRASLDLSQADKLAGLPEVKWIEPYTLPVLDNDVAAPLIGVQPVWDDHGLDGEGQIVAVADTGLDTGVNDATLHDDFEGRVVNIHSWAVQAEYRPHLDNTSWDDGAADVDSGHGTHVAGSVLGNGTRSSGAIRGMAHAARLVFQAIEQWGNWKPATRFADDYDLLGIPDDLNQLFQQAYNDGARIHSNSWNDSNLGQYTAASQDIDEFMWNHKDSLIVFSASNNGRDGNSNGVIDTDSLGSQACAKNCVTVGSCENNRATGGYNPGGDCDTYGNCWARDFPADPIRTDRLSNNPQGMVAFSGRGPTDDGRNKPDVVAPGTNILSVRSSRATKTGYGLLPAGNANRNFYMFMGGTSMSTPLTAGTVALIRQYVQKVHLHASPSGALLKALLLHGATPIAGQYVPSEVGTVPDNSQGWGRVNLRNSLFPDLPVKIEFRDNPTHALGTGETRDYSFQVVDSSVPFRATLAWTDSPSNPASGGLVNRLRLEVVRPNGTTVQGAPANNNVQQVVINTPATGAYTVRVRGINVTTQATTGAKQDFAVVVGAGLQFVDLYIRDNHADDGEAPSRGTLYQSPDIWISLSNDPAATPVAKPEHGQTNYVFVRVRNRGSQAAANATVKLYWTLSGTNLSRPHWKTTDITVDGAAGNTRQVTVPARSATGDGEATTAAFEWLPPDPATNVAEPGHFCLFATVTHPNDPILQEDVNAVRWEDNLAWKNVSVQDMLPDTTTTMEFYVAGIAGASSIADLHIDRSELPIGGGVKLKIPSRYLEDSVATNLQTVWQSAGGRVCQVEVTSPNTGDLRGIDLRPGENTLVRLEVTLPEDAEEGEVYPVFVEQRVNGSLTGRVTLVARAVGTPAYIANRRSRELHLPDCQWARKMSPWNKIPYDDLDTALRRGYNGCHFCLREYDSG